MFVDYKTKAGKWITFKPLPLIKREELSKRFNSFNKFIPISHQIVDSDEMEYNLSQILLLYGLDLNEFSIDEIDTLISDYIIKVNFSQKDLKKINISDISKSNAKTEESEDIISRLLTSLWGICENAGDAIYMLDKLPADILLETIKLRSEDLERMYMTDDEKRKKEQKQMREQLMKKHER